MMKDRKIYITNYFPYQNYEDAFKYTSLSRDEAQVILFNNDFNLRDPNRLCFEILKKIKNSKKNDLLLLTGKGILDGFVLLVWFIRHHVINVLLFEQRQRKYILRTLDIKHLTEELYV